MKTKLAILLGICLLAITNSTKAQTTGTFTDPRDGQVYKTITVEDPLKGTSVTWLAQNLNYQVSGAKPYDNDESYRKNLGLLYTAEQARQACPPGWHIPSKTEFESLLKENTTEALKSTKGWSNNGNGTNASGFNAFPAGYIYMNPGSISQRLGEIAYFWTTTNMYSDIYNVTAPAHFYLNIRGGASFSSGGDYYVSVRCIKNN